MKCQLPLTSEESRSPQTAGPGLKEEAGSQREPRAAERRALALKKPDSGGEGEPLILEALRDVCPLSCRWWHSHVPGGHREVCSAPGLEGTVSHRSSIQPSQPPP